MASCINARSKRHPNASIKSTETTPFKNAVDFNKSVKLASKFVKSQNNKPDALQNGKLEKLNEIKQLSSAFRTVVQSMKAEQKRLEEQQEIERQKIEEARIAKAKAEAFACKRCPAKYPSNTKLHEHVRNHHAKKSKSAISSVATSSSTSPQSIVVLSPTPPPSTPPHSIAFLFDISNLVTTSKPQQTIVVLSNTSSSTSSHSIISPPSTSKRVFSPTSSKRSSLSNSASEFVSKRSENASLCSLTSSSTPAFMRSTPSFIKSTFATPTKPYLTIIDLFNMFAGKSMRAKLFPSQNSPSSPGISAPRQARITSYFLPTSAPKSTKSEAFTAVHAPMKQSIRATPSRSSFRPSPSSPSTRFSFSTTPYSSPVCWHCQAPLATYLHSNGCLRVAGKAGIPVGRRGRRLFRKVWADC